MSAVTVREVNGWLAHLSAAGNTGRDGVPAPMAGATVGNGFFTWVAAHRPTCSRTATRPRRPTR